MFSVLKCLTYLLFDVCQLQSEINIHRFFLRTKEIQVDMLHEQSEISPDGKFHLRNLALDICLWLAVFLKEHQLKQVPIQEKNI